MIRVDRQKKVLLNFIDIFGKLIFDNKFLKKKRILSVSEINKLLIIEIWSIGDLIMITPLLIALRNKLPTVEITLLSKSYASELLKYSPVNKYVFFDFPWTRFAGKYKVWKWNWLGLLKLIKRLREEKYDLSLDARGDFRNNLLSFLIGAKRRIGYDWTGGGYFLTDVAQFDYNNGHRVDAWLNLLNYLGIKVESPKPYLSVAKDEEEWAESFLREKGIGEGDLVIGIHPGARIKTRCWPLDRFAEVADYIKDNYKSKIIVFIEPDDYGQDIPIKKEHLKVKVSLRQLIALIKQLNLLICNDGGAMHIATAVDTPVVAIFGPTNPVWFGPYGNNHSIIIKEDIKCRPCFDYCKYKEPFCITKISVEEVLKEVDSKIKDINLRRAVNEFLI